MFYINSKILRKREVLFLHILPTTIIFTAFIVITLLSWTTAKTNVKTEQIKTLEQNNSLLASHIRESVSKYEDILRGAAGLIESSDQVTRNEWKSYVGAYDVNSRYNGIQAIGYIGIITDPSKQKHVAELQSSYDQKYSIFPESSKSFYTPIIYIEPTNEKNISAIGFDMYSESVRQNAMDEARDSGKAVISEKITLIQDRQDANPKAGFLIFLPVYKKSADLSSIENRRDNIQGYVYAAFRLHELINSLPDDTNEYGFVIHTGDIDGEVVYKSSEYDSLYAFPLMQQSIEEMNLLGKKWVVRGVVSTAIVNDTVRSRPPNVLWGGLMFSLLVAGFIYLLLGNRTRALADKEAKSIQDAKDELLALASHQLRTPATGVKQYVGMLREGFSGKLEPSQKQLLDKAYESNERQLATINEMLFVARADAGHLNFNKKRLNFTELLQRVLEEQEKIRLERKQKVSLKIPKKPIFIDGDAQFLSMAIENIINNAFKYTKKGGRVYISLVKSKGSVKLIVKDTGVGVAPQDKVLLFQKFSRIPNDLTNEVSGTGIGLYLAKKLVEAHSGTINFDSTEGSGSTVSIELPIASPQK